LESGSQEYFDAIRNLNDSGQFEFWNHGYTHKRNPQTKLSEFVGQDFETQLESLSHTQSLAVEKLGFPFRSFGAPFNSVDANTVLAVREHPEITTWLYGLKGAELLPQQVILKRTIHIEHPTSHPNFEKFKKSFLANPSHPYYLLQGHPGSWDEERFEEFSKIIAFLQEQGARFVTPSELIQMKPSVLP
jgi:peptidoglycan/xylan/chitin deacetylase (PgdA/CDA1 family)